MDTGWTTAPLGAEDYDAILALWQAAGLSIRPNGRDNRSQFEAQLASGTHTVLGVRDGGQLAGVIIATHDGRKGWLNRLAVHPDYQRRGIGLHLIRAGEQALKSQGMQIIAALVEDWNQASLALMARAGYKVHPDVHYLTKRDHDDV